MDLTLMSLFVNTCLFLATLLICGILYFNYQLTFWNKYSLPVVPAKFPFGSLGNIARSTEPVGVSLAKIYKQFKDQKARHGGIYILNDAIYMPVDPVIIKNILIKDFNSFTDRSMYVNLKDILNVNVLTLDGQKWKSTRAKLTPTFSSGKMKQMFQVFLDCGEKLVKKVNEYEKRNEQIGTKNLLACFTTDVIGNCAFGIECNSVENPDCDFRKYSTQSFDLKGLQAFKIMIARSFPNIARLFGVTTVSQDVSEFFIGLVEENIRYRKTNNYKRNDFFQLLVDLEDSEPIDQTLKRNFIAAHTFLFFAAGFETSATTMTAALYELASNPQIQDKLRNEIMATIEKHGKVSYEAIMDMEYLSKVVDETLRKHPPFPLLSRRCTQNYRVEGTDVIVEKGMRVFVSLLGLHYDPDYFPQPETFDPERFNEENRNSRPACTFMPFGEGPRNCIGLRFGLLQVKVGLVILLKNFKFSVNSKTGTPELDPGSFINRFKNEIWLNVKSVDV